VPHVVLTQNALKGIKRCTSFLEAKSPSAAQRGVEAIRKHLAALRHSPDIGRPFDDALRELVIPFGDAGYVALYLYDSSQDTVTVLEFRHQREAGY